MISSACTPKSMRMLGTVDLEMLQMAAASASGTINESMLERSGIKRLGVGRTLDALASLRDRGLLDLNKNDGSFQMTPAAYGILWTDSIPLWARILRLLEIRSCTRSEISIMLCVADEGGRAEIDGTLGGLQRAGLAMMAPQIRDDRPQKVYEILPEGVQALESEPGINAKEFGSSIPAAGVARGPRAIAGELEQMMRTSSIIDSDEGRAMLQKITHLQDELAKMPDGCKSR